MYNLHLFGSSLSFIFNIIIFFFLLPLFLIYHTGSSLNKILGCLVSPFSMQCLICCKYTVPRPMGGVVGFPHGWYAHTIMHIFPLLPFIFIQHHLPFPILSVPDSDTQPAIASKAKVPVPLYCAPLSYPYTLCVYTEQRSVSDNKFSSN